MKRDIYSLLLGAMLGTILGALIDDKTKQQLKQTIKRQVKKLNTCCAHDKAAKEDVNKSGKAHWS